MHFAKSFANSSGESCIYAMFCFVLFFFIHRACFVVVVVCTVYLYWNQLCTAKFLICYTIRYPALVVVFGIRFNTHSICIRLSNWFCGRRIILVYTLSWSCLSVYLSDLLVISSLISKYWIWFRKRAIQFLHIDDTARQSERIPNYWIASNICGWWAIYYYVLLAVCILRMVYGYGCCMMLYNTFVCFYCFILYDFMSLCEVHRRCYSFCICMCYKFISFIAYRPYW